MLKNLKGSFLSSLKKTNLDKTILNQKSDLCSWATEEVYVSLVLIFGILVCRFVQIIWPTWAWWGHNLLLPRDILRSESDCFFLILPLNLGRKLHFTSENKENFLSLWPFHPLQNLIWYKTWNLGHEIRQG